MYIIGISIMMNPPWLSILMQTVRGLYSTDQTAWIRDVYNRSDVMYIEKLVASSDFDTLGLQRGLWDAVKSGNAYVRKYSCLYGSILLIYEKDKPWKFPFEKVGSIMKLFYNPTTPFRVVFFGSRAERRMPIFGRNIEKEHINGGYTMPCDPGTIVVYRREEVERVFIHECLHASCSDPTGLGIPHVEADTEAWAEIIMCALVSRGNLGLFLDLFRDQMLYARKQSEKLALNHNVKTSDDYGWRYTTGKLQVWERLGFKIPANEKGKGYTSNSLKLSKI